MKRMLIVHEVYGRLAGAEQNIAVTVPHLAERSTVDMLFDRRSGKDEDRFDTFVSGTHQVPFDGPAGDTRARVNAVLAKACPDLVYVHKCVSIPVLRALVDSGLPLVRMEHDHDIYCMRSYKYFPWSRRICTRKAGPYCLVPCLGFLKRDRSRGRFGIRLVSYRRQMQTIALSQRFNATFVVTRYMRDELIRQGFARENIHIFPPVPIPSKQDFESTFSDRNLIIYAGQIIRGKGVDCLIRAVAQLTQPARLIVLGSGSHVPACEALVEELGLGDRVEFPGFVSQETLADYYRNATVVAVPSVWPEPIATVGLEVLRYGLPVVGFDAGGISDWLIDGETGFLIPWMDIPRMAERMDRLLSDKALARQLGRQGREFVNREYNFDDYIKRLQGTLLELANGQDTRT